MNTPAKILLPRVELRPEWRDAWLEPTDDVQPLDAPRILSAGSTVEFYVATDRYVLGEITRREP